MTASLRRTVTVTVAALGVALLLVWAATTGPARVIGDSRGDSGPQPAQVEPTSDPAERGTPETDTTDPEKPRDAGSVAAWAQDLAGFLAVAAGLLLLGRLLHHVLARIRRGLEVLDVPLEPLPDLAVARAAVERDQDRQRAALAGSDVRNGIVECWVLFEQAAEEADVGRRPAETSTEFVVRFLHLLDIDPRPVGELERLFHEARFSTHPLAADARARAQQALAGIHRELAQTGVAT